MRWCWTALIVCVTSVSAQIAKRDDTAPAGREEWVEAVGLTRQGDDIVALVHGCDGPTRTPTVSGHGAARDFRCLTHWVGRRAPLRLVVGESGAATLLDVNGTAVHLAGCTRRRDEAG